MIDARKLDYFINNRFNVLFEGEKGVGKTSMIIDAFKRAGLRYRYFSASTMDVWTDFIGLPKEVTDQDGTYLTLCKPKEFATDSVDAVIFDEYNRAPTKVKNACMEIIQFGSINGVKFNNLKMAWAAINPDNGDYQVEAMDPAQEDRFHAKLLIPYALNEEYLVKKYPDTAGQAIEWWNELDDDSKRLCSPRRLEYCLKAFQSNGDLNDFLDSKLNVSSLIFKIGADPIKKRMKSILSSQNRADLKSLINGPNFKSALYVLNREEDLLNGFAPFITGDVKKAACLKFPNIEKFFNDYDARRQFVRFFEHYRHEEFDWRNVNVHFSDASMTRVHRDGQPAIISEDALSFAYVEDGKYHRDDGIAIERHEPGGWKRYWYNNGKEHREGIDQPSYQDSWGTQMFKKNGVLNGDNVVKFPDGCCQSYRNNVLTQSCWFNQHNQLHRDGDLPARIVGGVIEYWQNGALHRDNGPAVIEKSSPYRVYIKNGKIHRDDGPAVTNRDGTSQYYLNNAAHTKEQWLKATGKTFLEPEPNTIYSQTTDGGGKAIISYYKDEQKTILHRKNGPAVVCENGDFQYWLEGQRHNSNPNKMAVKRGTCQEFWQHNKLHRINGPAVIVKGTTIKEWWLEGVQYTMEQHLEKVKELGYALV